VPPPETDVAETASVARFYYDSDCVNASGVVHTSVFMPREVPEFQRYETSVCVLGETTDEARLWSLANVRHKPPRGRAEVAVSAITARRLACLSSPEDGYDEHAVIVKWPDDKKIQKQHALALARSAMARAMVLLE
jgi:hypothetical protein